MKTTRFVYVPERFRFDFGSNFNLIVIQCDNKTARGGSRRRLLTRTRLIYDVWIVTWNVCSEDSLLSLLLLELFIHRCQILLEFIFIIHRDNA